MPIFRIETDRSFISHTVNFILEFTMEISAHVLLSVESLIWKTATACFISLEWNATSNEEKKSISSDSESNAFESLSTLILRWIKAYVWSVDISIGHMNNSKRIKIAFNGYYHVFKSNFMCGEFLFWNKLTGDSRFFSFVSTLLNICCVVYLFNYRNSISIQHSVLTYLNVHHLNFNTTGEFDFKIW